ncbi:MAG: phosphatase PAP2 family protein [Taibaiella sp.]|nr:phosphatase PAP2 family protein [Taibaiella sp.]
MLQQLHDMVLRADYTTWYYLNVAWHNPFFDAVIPFFRNQWFWVPLYVFLAIFMPYNYRRQGIFWCIGFIITFALADSVSASFIKPHIHRLRPCNDPYLSGIVHLLVPCGSGFSFPSSHASNHFALALFGAVTIGKRTRWIWPIALFWAALISYSQVYVGVHFPLDVFCGALFGILVGLGTGKLFNRYFSLQAA